MRVIAGSMKGRRLRAPKGDDVRPTSNKVRGALFNIVGARIEGATMIDLFAGTGSVGIEAASRGAAHVLFVEDSRASTAALASNLTACGLFNGPRMKGDRVSSTAQSDRPAGQRVALWTNGGVAGLLSSLKRNPTQGYDLIFADPPYGRPETLRLLRPFLSGLGVAPEGWLVIEHARTATLPPPAAPMVHVRSYRYGETVLAVYAKYITPQADSARVVSDPAPSSLPRAGGLEPS
jgi:16S rRNA (guanine(966)-N(2))-methyltransferase RsmD